MGKVSIWFENFLLSIKSVIKVIFSFHICSLKKTNKNRVFVLANGPSLKESLIQNHIRQNLEKEDLICVNFFYKSEFFYELKPKYYIISASEFWTDFGENEYAPHIDLFYALEKITWEIDFFIPAKSKSTVFWKEIVRKNRLVNIVYYNDTTIEGLKSVSDFLYKTKLGVPRSHNILGNSIMSMIWKGYKEVALLGVDHSWLQTLYVSEDNVAFLSDHHFYAKKAAPRIMRKQGLGQRKLHEIVFKFYLAFKAYHEINRFAISQNVKIFNLTPKSNIDAFERKEIQDYLIDE